MLVPKQLQSIPISKLAPSFVTLMALCMGITSIRYAFDEKWTIAVALIIIAAVMDGIDGRLARMLNSTSSFGEQLDSLSDIVSFGVAPAVVIYLWSLHEIPYKGVGWAVVLFFIACSAIRLARFNSNLSNPKDKPKSNGYFQGVPMPCGAALILLPLTMTFELLQIEISPWFMAVYIIFVGSLMISTLPINSFKNIHINREYVPLTLIISALLMAGIFLEPWLVLPFFGLGYLVVIPLSIYKFKKSKK